MKKILTLCDKCQKEIAEGFLVEPINVAPAERKRICENCGTRSSYFLPNYMVENKKERQVITV